MRPAPSAVRGSVPDKPESLRESVVILPVIPLMSDKYFVLFHSIYTGIELAYWPMCAPPDDNNPEIVPSPAFRPGIFAFYGIFNEFADRYS